MERETIVSKNIEEMNESELSDLATRLLRESNYTWSGRDKAEINPKQCEFEQRMQRGAYNNGGEKNRYRQ